RIAGADRNRRRLAGGRVGGGGGPAAGWAGIGSDPLPRRRGDGTGRGASRSGRGTRMRSDLADQVQRRLQGLLAFLPLGRADLVRVGGDVLGGLELAQGLAEDRKSTRLNSSHVKISYAVF